MKKPELNLRRIVFGLSLLTVLSVTIGGYLYYSTLRESALESAHRQASEHLKTIVDHIDLDLSWSLKSVGALAGLGQLQQTLVSGDTDALQETNAILDHFRNTLKASVCYLMDSSGKTVASTNRYTPTSFVGKNYGFRPYFRQAMRGAPATYLALGVTSKKRGIYFSHPVYGKGHDEPLGVAVIKASVEPIEEELKKPHDGIALITAPNGVVFASDHKEWLYHVLWKVSSDEISQIAKTRQFGRGPWNWTGLKRLSNDRAVDRRGIEYYLHQAQIDNLPGWKVIFLHAHHAVSERVTKPLLRTIGFSIMAVWVVVGFFVFLLYTKASSEITHRKKAEEALRESEDRYRTLFEQAPDAIFLSDTQDHIIDINPAVCQLMGYTRDELLKMTIADLQAPGARSQRGTIIKAELEEHQGKFFEGMNIHKDGTLLPVEIRTAPLIKRELALSIVRDISDRKRVQAEKEKLQTQLLQSQKIEAIATLAGGIAHQFNNALSVITAELDFLEMDFREDENKNTYTGPMRDSALRMAQLTSQLLAYARGGKYQAQTLSLRNFVNNTLPIIEHSLDSSVQIETDLSGDIFNVEVDLTQMQMVLSALLKNASEAIEGEGRIKISIRNEDIDEAFTQRERHPDLKRGQHVCLSVEDDGKGMDEEIKNRIFEPFFTTKFQGRGLGMAAAYGIIKNHDGRISVASEPGQGTTVRIYLPAVAAEPKEPKTPKRQLSTGSGTLLVIEDEEMVLEIIKALLEKLGYHVLSARTGQEAIEIAETFDGHIDLTILDMVLPDMGGKAIYALLKAARPKLKVIVCSGYSIDGPAQEILDAGAEAFIQKPFSITELSDKLKEVLEAEK